MYTRICPATAHCFDLLPEHRRKSFIYTLLNRYGIVLDLPAVVGRAFERDLRKVSLHCFQDRKGTKY